MNQSDLTCQNFEMDTTSTTDISPEYTQAISDPSSERPSQETTRLTVNGHAIPRITSKSSLLHLGEIAGGIVHLRKSFEEEREIIKEEMTQFRDKVVTMEHNAEQWIHDHIRIRGYASSFGAGFNIMNATIGAGILSLPYVLKELGIVLGVVLMVFGFLVTNVSLHYLHTSHQILLEKQPDACFYEDIGYFAYGTWFRWLIKLLIFFAQVGTLTSFLQVIANFMQPIWAAIAGADSIMTQRWLILLIVFVPITMISMIKRMHDLRFISYISIFSIISFVIFLVVCYFANLTALERKGTVHFVTLTSEAPKMIGMIVFAFSCSSSLIPINYEYEAKQHKLIQNSITFGGFSTLLIYITCAIFGYLCFLDSTKAPIVSSFVYDKAHWYNYIFTALFCMVIFLTFPISMITCRLALDNILAPLWRWKIPKTCDRPLKSENESFDHIYAFLWKQGENVRFFFLTVMLCMICVTIAIFIPEVRYIMQVSGASTTTALGFVIPNLLYVKLTPLPWKSWKVILSLCICIFGVIFGSVTTIYSLVTIIMELTAK
jgi:sodium-coupled neutral amino acid transporter 11